MFWTILKFQVIIEFYVSKVKVQICFQSMIICQIKDTFTTRVCTKKTDSSQDDRWAIVALFIKILSFTS